MSPIKWLMTLAMADSLAPGWVNTIMQYTNVIIILINIININIIIMIIIMMIMIMIIITYYNDYDNMIPIIQYDIS